MKFPLLGRLTVVGAALVLSFSANAAFLDDFLEMDFYTSGDGLITYDRVSGLKILPQMFGPGDCEPVSAHPDATELDCNIAEAIPDGFRWMRTDELRSIHDRAIAAGEIEVTGQFIGTAIPLLGEMLGADYFMTCNSGECDTVTITSAWTFLPGGTWSRISPDFNIAYNGAQLGGPRLLVSSIPIPTTAWLFGSALAGLLVIRRRNY
ncbi:hypothetical protein OAG89_03365 [Pseudomonadales bacterium]|nr:hypothetical protein [Pseudomonadales bacterium]